MLIKSIAITIFIFQSTKSTKTVSCQAPSTKPTNPSQAQKPQKLPLELSTPNKKPLLGLVQPENRPFDPLTAHYENTPYKERMPFTAPPAIWGGGKRTLPVLTQLRPDYQAKHLTFTGTSDVMPKQLFCC